MKLLWGAAGQLVPILGQMVWTGCLEERLRAAPGSEPDFAPQQLGRYLSLGLWPFLMQLVIGLAVLALLPPVLVLLLAAGLTCGGFVSGGNGWLLGGLCLFALGLFLLAGMVVMEFVTLPFNLLASFEQNFMRALDLQFFPGFTGKVHHELWLS